MGHRVRLTIITAFAFVAPACGAGDRAVDVPWLRADAVSSTLLKVGYESDPCTRARKAFVEEAAHAVTVTLLDPKRDPNRACIETAEPGCVTVRLSEPVGGRRIVDGAADRVLRRKRGPDRLPFSRFGRCRPIPVER